MKSGDKETRLLLVDDEPEFLDSTARALARRGFRMETALDGDAALEILDQREVDVVVLDVMMPGMRGDQLFRRIKSLRPGLPIIMLTGHGTAEQAFQISRQGAFDYLSKPCAIDELADVVRRAAEAQGAAVPLEGEEERMVRLLIVDDEPEFLAGMAAVLGRRGMRVLTAQSPGEALQEIDDRLFDVILLDIKMPQMSGMELLPRIKQAQPQAEVIFLTGHPTVGTAFEGMKKGAFEYLTKPPDIEALTEKIQEACRRSRRRAEGAREQKVKDLLEERGD